MNHRRIVIHQPEKGEDMQKLLHEISELRAEKTMKYLRDIKLTPLEITELINEV